MVRPLKCRQQHTDTVAHLERKIADLEEEKATLQMLVEQLQYQKNGLLRLCDEKLAKGSFEYAPLRSGLSGRESLSVWRPEKHP